MSMKDAVRDVAVGAAAGVAVATAYEAYRKGLERDILDGKPTRLEKIDPRTISADPETFQFKSGGDNKGVTDRLKDVKQWDPVAAGKGIVFEKADGTRVIADGHQRLGLATRLAEQGQNVRMDAYVMRERDGWTPRDVRAYAAIKNMQEGSGASLDMAKVMRERPDLVNTGRMPLSDVKVRESKSLAQLSEPAFKMVVGGAVKPEHAAAVGESVTDAGRHADMLAEMVKAKVESAQHARLYVSQAMAAPTITESHASLFGEETSTRSLLAERAKILDKAMSALKSDKRIFGLLEREASNIEAAGNKLAHETNIAKAEGAGKLASLVEKLSTTRGAVSTMLDRAAAAVANGEPPSKAARAFVRQVGDVMKQGGMQALMGDAPARMQMMADPPKQSSMFGAPSTADKIAAEVRAKEAKGRTGDPMNEGLFGSGRLQADLVDMAKQPARYAAAITEQREAVASGDQGRIAKANEALDAHHNGGWSDAAREASADARKADPHAAERERIANGTKRIGDTYKAPAPAAPTAADKFTSGMKPMTAAKAKAALETQVRHNGKEFLSRAALVEREIANGATVQTMKIAGKDQRVLMGKDGAFLDTRNITKAGLDYAEHLSAMKPTNPNYTPGVGTKQESYWSHKAPPTPTVNELPPGAFSGTQRDFESLSPGMRREIKRAAELEAIKQKTRDALGPNGDGKHRRTDGTPILPKGNVDMYGVYTETSDVKARIEHLKQGLSELPAGAIRDAAENQIKMLSDELSKRNPGWSDEARAASAEVRGEKAMAKGDNAAVLLNAQKNFKAKYGGDFDMMQHATAADLRKMIDGRMTQKQAFAELDRIKTAGERRLAAAETSVPASNSSEADSLRAGRINRLKNRAAAGEITGAAADKFVADNLAKLEALDAKRAAPAAPVETSEQRNARIAANMPRATTHEDLRKPLLKDKDVKALLKEGSVTKADVKSSRTMRDLNELVEKTRASRAADRGMMVEAFSGTGLRGTQNEANREAIIKNRKANAKGPTNAELVRTMQATAMGAKRIREPAPVAQGKRAAAAEAYKAKFGYAPPSDMSSGPMKRWTDSPMKVGPGQPGDPAYESVVSQTKIKALQSAAKNEAAAKPAASPTKRVGRKALGLLAPVAIGAAALVAANRSAEAGETKTKQARAAGKEAAVGAGVMAGFVAGTAVIAKGFMKVGLTAAKAAPATQAVLMAGGAIHGAVTAAPGERMKGAARGAWDMSLPGMVVNTGAAVKDAVVSTRARSAGPARLTDQQQSLYADASKRHKAMREAAQSEDAGKKQGWSNAARIGAYKARMENAGQSADNLPYGGNPSNGPSQWAPSASSSDLSAAMKKR